MGQRRDEPPAPVGTIIEGELGKLDTLPPLPLRVLQAWDDAVGQRVARRARPARLKGRTLVVRVASNTWMTELQMLAPTILESLAERSGYKGITALRFELGPLPPTAPKPSPEDEPEPTPDVPLPEPIERALDEVDDETLRGRIHHTLARYMTAPKKK